MAARYFTGAEGSIKGQRLAALLALVPATPGAARGGLVWPDALRWRNDGGAWCFSVPPGPYPAWAEAAMKSFELAPAAALAMLATPAWTPPPPEDP